MEQIIKRIAFELWINDLIKRAVLRLPFLALPWVNPAFVWVFTKFLDWAYDETVDFIMFQYIAFRDQMQEDAYIGAINDFRKEAPTLDPEELMNGKARQILRNRARELVRFRLRNAA